MRARRQPANHIQERTGSSTPPLGLPTALLLACVDLPSVRSIPTCPTTLSIQQRAPQRQSQLRVHATAEAQSGIGDATTRAPIHWGDLDVWDVGCKSAGLRLFFEENKFPDSSRRHHDWYGCHIYDYRVCGGDPYPPCTGTSDNDKTTSFTDMTTSGTQPTESTNVPTGDCSSCGGSEWSSPCLEVGFQSKNCLPFVLCLEMTLVWYLSTKLLGHFPEICVQPGTFSWGLVFKNNHIPFFQKKYFLAGY